MTIVTLTMNPALDASFEVERVEPEVKLRCRGQHRDPGGGGINVARAIHELGRDACAVYPAGGHPGEELSERIDACGVDNRPVEIEGATRENITVVERESGRQFRFTLPGAELSGAEQDRCLEVLGACMDEGSLVVISGSLAPGAGPDLYTRAVEAAHERSNRVVGDSSGEALDALAGAGPFLLKPNRRALGRLVGRELRGKDQAREAADELVGRGVAEHIVVSMGARGAVLVCETGAFYASGPEVEADSVIGAGDSMVGALTLALHRGLAPERVLAWGVGAGTAAVLTPGTRLLDRSDFERLLEEVEVEELAPSA